jgi:hypothetical protein
MIKSEGERLRDQISEIWPDTNGATFASTFDLEADLVVNTVTYAILNPGTNFNFSSFQTSNYIQYSKYWLGCLQICGDGEKAQRYGIKYQQRGSFRV